MLRQFGVRVGQARIERRFPALNSDAAAPARRRAKRRRSPPAPARSTSCGSASCDLATTSRSASACAASCAASIASLTTWRVDVAPAQARRGYRPPAPVAASRFPPPALPLRRGLGGALARDRPRALGLGWREAAACVMTWIRRTSSTPRGARPVASIVQPAPAPKSECRHAHANPRRRARLRGCLATACSLLRDWAKPACAACAAF